MIINSVLEETTRYNDARPEQEDLVNPPRSFDKNDFRSEGVAVFAGRNRGTAVGIYRKLSELEAKEG